MGSINEEGIYLSWAHFLREFNDYTDGQNVGLHEMAHALTYVNFTAHRGRDRTFHDTFESLCCHQLPGILGSMRRGFF